MDFFIKMKWDSDLRRWAAIGSTGMGLVLESDSFDLLIDSLNNLQRENHSAMAVAEWLVVTL